MSHFTTIKAEFRDLQTLIQTLSLLGLEFRENGSILGHAGQTEAVDLAVKVDGGFRLGFNENVEKKCYEIRGLKEFLQERRVQKIVNEIRQEYAYQKVLFETRTRGFALIQEEKVKHGIIRLVLRKVA